jgi:hypothetical protein
MFQALISLVASFFGFQASASAPCPNPALHETREDCPWAAITRNLDGVSDPDLITKVIEDAVPGFLSQLDQDAKTKGLFDLWGLSRNIDESNLASGKRTVPPNLIQFFNRNWNVPYDSQFVVGHAGLNHTYGYLFSVLETPYGYKRARYVRHELEAGFGLKEGTFGGHPEKGTLLLNLSLFAGRIAFRDNPEALAVLDRILKDKKKPLPSDLVKFDIKSVHPKRLIESFVFDLGTEGSGEIEMRTDIVPFLQKNPHGKNTALLIHSMLIQKKNAPKASPQLITVFPVEGGFGDSLFKPETFGDQVPLKLRYNAALPFSIAPEKMVGKRYLSNEPK